MKRFPLQQSLPAIKFFVGLGIIGLVPTLGVVFSVFAAAVPVVLGFWLSQSFPAQSEAIAGITLFLGVISWFLAAIFVAGSFLKSMRWLGRFRARFGSVSLGRDGFGVRRHVLDGSFTSWDQVDSLHLDGDALVVTMDDGAVERIEPANASGALAEMKDFRERHREAEPGPRVQELEHLDDEVAWLARAQALGNASEYRQASRGPDVLVRIAEDPTASAAQRVGSALALSKASQAVRARVKLAIDETADEELADTMEDALTGKLKPKQLARLFRAAESPSSTAR